MISATDGEPIICSGEGELSTVFFEPGDAEDRGPLASPQPGGWKKGRIILGIQHQRQEPGTLKTDAAMVAEMDADLRPSRKQGRRPQVDVPGH